MISKNEVTSHFEPYHVSIFLLSNHISQLVIRMKLFKGSVDISVTDGHSYIIF